MSAEARFDHAGADAVGARSACRGTVGAPVSYAAHSYLAQELALRARRCACVSLISPVMVTKQPVGTSLLAAAATRGQLFDSARERLLDGGPFRFALSKTTAFGGLQPERMAGPHDQRRQYGDDQEQLQRGFGYCAFRMVSGGVGEGDRHEQTQSD